MLPWSSTPSSIKRSARDTVVDVPFDAGVPGVASGLHLRHGRKPAASASAGVLKNTTFSAAGFFAEQLDLQ